MSDEYDHAGLKELARGLGRPLYPLEVLKHDPFTAGAPARKAGAEWFARLWKRRPSLGVQPRQKLHLHGFHYVMVSQQPLLKIPDGSNYENTTECEAVLIRCALDARYLELVSADDFNDRRSVEPTINDAAEGLDPSISITGGLGEIKYEPPEFKIPKLEVYPPTLLPHDHLEIWIGKSTQHEVSGPLCEKHGIDFRPGVGEFSLARCLQLVQRAEAHHPRATRVGTVTDFDPAGQSIPVGIARKAQHLLHIMGLDLDIRVEPIALTHDQCVELELPRTPLKASELRAANFEARFGKGATELDTLEALHPGRLEETTRDFIERTDRFKEHQGKPTEERDRSAPRTGSIQIKKCIQCGDDFEARRSDVQIWSAKCRIAYQRARNRGEAPPSARRGVSCTCEFCGDDFLSATPRARCCGKPKCITKLKADNAKARRQKRATEKK
jgi:hypothetical protein